MGQMLDRLGELVGVTIPVLVVGMVAARTENAETVWQRLPAWGKHAASISAIVVLLGSIGSCTVGAATMIGRYTPVPAVVAGHTLQIDSLRRGLADHVSVEVSLQGDIDDVKCALAALARANNPDVIACLGGRRDE